MSPTAWEHWEIMWRLRIQQKRAFADLLLRREKKKKKKKRKTGVATLISEKIDFKIKAVTRDK